MTKKNANKRYDNLPPITTDDLIDFHFKNQKLETWDDLLNAFKEARRQDLFKDLSKLPKEYKVLIDSLILNEFSLVKYLDGTYIHSQWIFGPLYVTILKQNLYYVYNIETHEEYQSKVENTDLVAALLQIL